MRLPIPPLQLKDHWQLNRTVEFFTLSREGVGSKGFVCYTVGYCQK